MKPQLRQEGQTRALHEVLGGVVGALLSAVFAGMIGGPLGAFRGAIIGSGMDVYASSADGNAARLGAEERPPSVEELNGPKSRRPLHARKVRHA